MDFPENRGQWLYVLGCSFEFLETVGFTETHKPARPYQSWGTEFVYVVEDKGDFISLQHILVMYFEANYNSRRI